MTRSRWYEGKPMSRHVLAIADLSDDDVLEGAEVEAAEAKGWQPTVVFVDDKNRQTGVDAEVAGPKRRLNAL